MPLEVFLKTQLLNPKTLYIVFKPCRGQTVDHSTDLSLDLIGRSQSRHGVVSHFGRSWHMAIALSVSSKSSQKTSNKAFNGSERQPRGFKHSSSLARIGKPRSQPKPAPPPQLMSPTNQRNVLANGTTVNSDWARTVVKDKGLCSSSQTRSWTSAAWTASRRCSVWWCSFDYRLSLARATTSTGQIAEREKHCDLPVRGDIDQAQYSTASLRGIPGLATQRKPRLQRRWLSLFIEG